MAMVNKVNLLPEERIGCHAITAQAQAFCGPLWPYFAVQYGAPLGFSLPTLRLHLQPRQGNPHDRRGDTC